MQKYFTPPMNRFFILLVLAFSVLPFFFIDASGEMLFKTMEQNYNTGSVVYILLLRLWSLPLLSRYLPLRENCLA